LVIYALVVESMVSLSRLDVSYCVHCVGEESDP
jgi:hypothetical protein